jgi:translation initiation factor RLI1
MPRPNQVLGLVGTNGIGKSTALKILSGKLKPNLGRYDNPPDWEDVIKYFRGSELQSETFPYTQADNSSGIFLLILQNRLLYQALGR